MDRCQRGNVAVGRTIRPGIRDTLGIEVNREPSAPAAAVRRPRARPCRLLFGVALGIYRRRFLVLAAVGVTLFVPLTVLESLAGMAINGGLAGGDGGSGPVRSCCGSGWRC